MLPNLGRLNLRAKPTGEFVRLSRAEARRLNNAGVREPINKTKYLPSDCDPNDEHLFGDDYECFEPFKVWIKDPATGRPGRKYHIYNAQALWDALPYMDKLRDPVTRQPFWREDWFELHKKYDPDGPVPGAVFTLPRKNKHEGYLTEEEESDSDSDVDLDALEALEAEEANMSAEAWGRFWLKGHVTGEEKYIMETHYFKGHLKEYIRFHGIGLGITLDDISSYRFLVRSGYYATPAEYSGIPLQGDAPMPVTCVDLQLFFNRRSKADEFVDWVNAYMNMTRWSVLAQEMFGITVLTTDQPYSEYPEIQGPESVTRIYGGPPRIPIIPRSRYNEAEHWEVQNVYNVPFNMHGVNYLPDDANDSESEPDYRQEEMDDYHAMVMDNVRDAESRA